jgi:hypothetical protein
MAAIAMLHTGNFQSFGLPHLKLALLVKSKEQMPIDPFSKNAALTAGSRVEAP